MTVALCVIVVFGIVQAGGMDAVLAHASSLPGFLSFGQTYNAASGQAEPYGLIRALSTRAWGLGYFGMPHILVRFMAIRHEDELKLSRRIASIWVVISWPWPCLSASWAMPCPTGPHPHAGGQRHGDGHCPAV